MGIEEEVTAVVARLLKREPQDIDPKADLFMDMGVDSLLGVEILSALDQKFNLDIPEDRLFDVKSLEDIISLIKKLLENKADEASL